jgi:AraC family transcriptional regulator
MYYIYIHIDTDINIEDLSDMLNVSKFHMQRIFKEFFNRNIYETVKSIRLQKASNLLLTNKYSTISEIANSCGYSSQSSFIKAFKQRFNMTPKEWKNDGYINYSSNILKNTEVTMPTNADYNKLQPRVVKMPTIQSYYIRNNSYDSNKIKDSWQKLYAWILHNNITKYEEIALFHDNPTITPLHECQYVACITSQEKIMTTRLPQFKIADGIYAKFDVELKKDEILYFIHWIYHKWLPSSEFETSTKPPYAIYHENEYLLDSSVFNISFYVPIRY